MPDKTTRLHWLKYVFSGLLVLFVLIVVFYQQIFFGVAQLAAQQIAKSQAISLQFKIHGSIFSSLYIEDLHLQPLPENRVLPLERLDAKWIAVRYNLFSLLKKDFLNAIELVELRNIDVLVRPSSQPLPPPQLDPNGLRIPVVLPRKIDIQDVNLIVRGDGGDLEVNKFALQFQQGAQGSLSCESLRVPAVGAWNQLHGGLSYNQSKLALTDLALDPILDVRQLQIDLSGSEQGQYRMTLDAKALGSSLAANGSYIQPAAKPIVEVTLNVIDFDLAQFQKLSSIPISGSIPKIEVRLSGELDRPSSFSGSISTTVSALRYQDYVFGAAGLSLVIQNGKGEIQELSVNSGPNKVRVTGNFSLSDTLDELPTKSSANIGIAAAVSDPGRYVPGLNATSLATGSIGLLNGRAQAVFHESVAGISLPKAVPGFSVSAVDSNVFAVAKFPLSGDLWPSLAAVLFTDCGNISYQDARIQQIRLAAEILDGKTMSTKASMASGESRSDISANVPLPALDAPRPLDPTQIAGRLTFRLASISDFIKQNQIEGVLTADGDLRFDHLQADGTVRASGSQLKYRGTILQSLALDALFRGGKVQIQTCRVTLDNSNRVELQGTAQLADPYPYAVNGTIALADLAVFNGLLTELGQPAGLNGVLNGSFSVNGDVQHPGAQLQLSGDQLKYRGLLIPIVQIKAAVEDAKAELQTCRITVNQNDFIDVNGSVGIAAPFVYQARGEIALQDLAAFNELLKSAGQPADLSGNLNIDFSGKGDIQNPTVQLRVLGDGIKYRGLLTQNIDIEGEILHRKLDLLTCKIVFDRDNFIDAKGNALFEDPYNYDADATVQFQDLGFLNGLTKSFGAELGLGGKLNASWKGNGPLKNQTGNVELHCDQLRTKTVENIKLDATAHYQGPNAEVPQLHVASPYADLDASIRFSPQLFEIPELNIRRNGNTISGNVKIPLNLQSGQKAPFDLDRPVDINIQGDKIALDSFQSGKPQVTGTVGFRLQASQALRDPLIQFTASARDIRTTSVSSLSAATGDFSVRIADKLLTVDGKIQQADVHPLTVAGRIPLDVGQIIQTGGVPNNTPLQFALKWPDNNLSFVRKMVPDIKVVEGTASVDVSVNGTFKQPDLAGSIRSTLSRFQAKTDTVPPISNFSTNITFQQSHIQIAQLKGLAGGGVFGMNGGIDLTDGTNPKFDIGVTGNQVLLTRSDGIIVRANFNLAIRGPFSGGEVTGTVGITDSRFFKDIDILPLNLPGRPPPQSPAAAMPKIAVETPPFNAWKFDIAIRTDDPFLIQSNLARGKITINLQAGGTGAAPSLTGFVRVDRLVASLPFSRMEIDDGTISFVQGGNMLNPSLSITGRSTVSDYDVRARIFGNVLNPTVLLDSSPPLTQGDILVLLATGSTTSAFAQDPSLLAGRATFIVLEQVFQKLFPNTNHADEQKEPFIDRFSVNITPGNRVGEQDIVSSFKLTKNWEIIGDFGTSSYQGRLKYLVRFR